MKNNEAYASFRITLEYHILIFNKKKTTFQSISLQRKEKCNASLFFLYIMSKTLINDYRRLV